MNLRRNLGARRRAALGLALIASALAAGISAVPAMAGTASSIGPFVLTGGGSLPAIQVPSSSLLSFSEEIQANQSSKGYGGSHFAPQSSAALTITKLVDSTSPALLKAAASGSHYKTAALSWESDGTSHGLCLTDVFASSDQVGGSSGGGELPQEKVSFVYSKVTITVGAKPPCGGKPPPVSATLLGLGRHGSFLLARVDCLSVHCRGILTVSLPPAACRRGRSLCSFGGGKFAMGDGSVKIMRLAVPSSLSKWLAGHRHALLGAIIVVRGRRTALVQHEVLGAPATLPAGLPMETTLGAPGPADLLQSLKVTSCATPVVGTPTVVTVAGTLMPPRSGAKVTLTYTPIFPPPLPSPVIDSVTTDAAGGFSENFDRQQGGYPYSWNVVASIPGGGGYTAAQSVSCSIPIP